MTTVMEDQTVPTGDARAWAFGSDSSAFQDGERAIAIHDIKTWTRAQPKVALPALPCLVLQNTGAMVVEVQL